MQVGTGSFATFPRRTIAIKVAHAPDYSSQVEWKFDNLRAALAVVVPRPLAFYNPQSQRLTFPRHTGSPIDHVRTGRTRHIPHQSPFTPDFFPNVPASCAAPLPPRITNQICSLLSRTRPDQHCLVSPSLICPLYLSKELRPSAFVNPVNFALDAVRYDPLHGGDEEVPSKDEVAEGMGEMLATIHWQAGYDVRGIEFVMSCAPKSSGLCFYIIDFDQFESLNGLIFRMHAFNREEGEVSELVDAFFVKDPYYTRPVPNDDLYDSFKRGYVPACFPGLQTGAALFLQAIEAREAEKHHNGSGDVYYYIH